jgi:hypothetical protein
MSIALKLRLFSRPVHSSLLLPPSTRYLLALFNILLIICSCVCNSLSRRLTLKLTQEKKYEAQQSLNKCKQNEQLLNREIEYLRKHFDKFTSPQFQLHDEQDFTKIKKIRFSLQIDNKAN